MTKPQIWVAAFLVLFILLFALSRITKENKSTIDSAIGSPNPQSDMSSQDLTAEQLISKLSCTTCHGTDLKGTKMGPSLYHVAEYWKRDDLINYLRNPTSFSDTKRFQNYTDEFPGMIMPTFGHINVKDLGKIADYLLKLKPEKEKKEN
jgi:mono/diheme cytochrome c family protein